MQKVKKNIGVKIGDLPNDTTIMFYYEGELQEFIYNNEPVPHVTSTDLIPYTVNLTPKDLNETDFYLVEENDVTVEHVPSLQDSSAYIITDIFSYLYSNKQLSKFKTKESLDAYMEDGANDDGIIWSMLYKGSILNAIKYIKQDDVQTKKANKKFPLLDESFISEDKEWNELIPIARRAVEICAEVEMEEWENAIRDCSLNKEALCRGLVDFSKFFHNNFDEFSEVM